MKYKIRAGAERDMEEAASWYRENSVDPRVPVRFLLEVRAVFETIAESPGAFPEVHGDIRRCRVHAFPAYSVFYRGRTLLRGWFEREHELEFMLRRFRQQLQHAGVA